MAQGKNDKQNESPGISNRIAEILADVDYPAGKDDLLQEAAKRGADEDSLKALRAIPPVDYRSRAEVLASIDRGPAGAAGSDKGRRHREHTHTGVAQHMKDGEELPIEHEVGFNKGS